MSDPDTIAASQAPGPAAGHPPVVLLLDIEEARHAVMERAIAAAGGHVLRIAPGTLAHRTRPPTAGEVGLFGLSGIALQDLAVLEEIAACKRLGVPVLACAAGADRWPLRSKSRPLLAGAAQLLDSESPRFADDLVQVLAKTLQTLAESRAEQAGLLARMRQFGIVGTCPPLVSAFREAARFSQFSDLPLLICGASGTGKELVARAIAGMDPKRHAGPFVAINCAAVQPNLLESEFFGHRRGAFTGADRDRKGWIRSAEGGVLFLDEIGELELELQAKLLRVVQEGCVRAVGEEQEVAINVRFLAATNRDLDRLVAEGRFREDLYHRLRALVVHLPPLRERAADLPLLVDHFLRKHAGDGQDHGPFPEVSADFLAALGTLDLPGNLRQLDHLIQQSLLTRRWPGVLDLGDLPAEMLRQLSADPPEPTSASTPVENVSSAVEPLSLEALVPDSIQRVLSSPDWTLHRVLSECERRVCEAALEQARGNQTEAARLLGITSRSVYNKRRQHRLSV